MRETAVPGAVLAARMFGRGRAKPVIPGNPSFKSGLASRYRPAGSSAARRAVSGSCTANRNAPSLMPEAPVPMTTPTSTFVPCVNEQFDCRPASVRLQSIATRTPIGGVLKGVGVDVGVGDAVFVGSMNGVSVAVGVADGGSGVAVGVAVSHGGAPGRRRASMARPAGASRRRAPGINAHGSKVGVGLGVSVGVTVGVAVQIEIGHVVDVGVGVPATMHAFGGQVVLECAARAEIDHVEVARRVERDAVRIAVSTRGDA